MNDIFEILEQWFGDYFITPLSSVLFFDVAFFTDSVKIPFVVAWLVFGALFLTFRMSFINLRAFKHAIAVVRGKYDQPDEPGEISHFQALSSALSATVGVGNIAGVAVAVSIGGPGAVFWMAFAGFLGMSSKFAECTLGVMYRNVESSGKVLGGPMRYLSKGLEEKKWPKVGKTLAAMFGIMCIGGSLGGGNMFQANQAFAAVSNVFPSLNEYAWVFGLLMAFCVGAVILGGIRSIGTAASVIVPFMCAIYLIASCFVLVYHFDKIGGAFMIMFNSAFNLEAGIGGLVGVLMIGFQRAAFSNEAGIGSAAIAHSAVATKEPVREGIVATLEPFIDTVIICTMTGLVITVTGVYEGSHGTGVTMASNAFASVIPWFPYVLAGAVFLFAYSTMISWSYYGDRCWAYFFGEKYIIGYKIMFLVFTFLGTVFSLGQVLEFSDLMVLGMALPNLLGVLFLSNKVKAALDDYWTRYKNNTMPVKGRKKIFPTPIANQKPRVAFSVKD